MANFYRESRRQQRYLLPVDMSDQAPSPVCTNQFRNRLLTRAQTMPGRRLGSMGSRD